MVKYCSVTILIPCLIGAGIATAVGILAVVGLVNNNTRGISLDGEWSKWSPIHECTCMGGSYGTITYKRECNNPPPIGDGLPCPGADTKEEPCVVRQCPDCDDPTCDTLNLSVPEPESSATSINLDGEWSDWIHATDCDKLNCGFGTIVYTRECNNPPPIGDRLPCPGSDTKEGQCVPWPCPECDDLTCSDEAKSDDCSHCICQGELMSGFIRDSEGRPLRGVKVYLERRRWDPIAETDATGYFEINDVCGNYNLRAELRLYYPTTVFARTGNANNMTLAGFVGPYFIEQPATVTTFVGEHVDLPCEVHSEPPSTIHWFYNGQKVEDLLNSTKISVTASGTYFCTSTNPVGSVVSSVAEVRFLPQSDSGTCDQTPASKIKYLPQNCSSDGKPYIEVGVCIGEPCTNSGSTDRNQNKCAAVQYANRTVSCTDGESYEVRAVTACGCVSCGGTCEPYLHTVDVDIVADAPIVGRLTVMHGGVANVTIFNGTDVNETSEFWSGQVLPIDGKYITISFESSIFFPIVRQVGIESDGSTAILLQLREGNFSANNGGDLGGVTVSVRNKNVSMVFISPSNIENAPGTFTYVADDGVERLLQTFGVIALSPEIGQDPTAVDMELDMDELNMDDSDLDSEIWQMNALSGDWTSLGSISELETSSSRRKRSTENSRIVSLSITINLPQISGPSNIPKTLLYLNIDKPIIRGRECKMALRAFSDEELTLPLKGVNFDIYSIENERFIGRISAISGSDGFACATVPCGIEYEIYARTSAGVGVDPAERRNFRNIRYSLKERNGKKGLRVVADGYPTDNRGPIYRVRHYGSVCPTSMKIFNYFSFGAEGIRQCSLALKTVRIDGSSYQGKVIHAYTREVGQHSGNDGFFHHTRGVSDEDGSVCLVVPCDERYEFHVFVPQTQLVPEQIIPSHIIRRKSNVNVTDEYDDSGAFSKTIVVMEGSYRARMSPVKITRREGFCSGHNSYLQFTFNQTSFWSCDVVQREKGFYNSWNVDESICVGRAKFVTNDTSLLPKTIQAVSKFPTGETLGTCISSSFFSARFGRDGYVIPPDFEFPENDKYDDEAFKYLNKDPYRGRYISSSIDGVYYALFQFRCPTAQVSSYNNGTNWFWSANGTFPEVELSFSGGNCEVRKSARVISIESDGLFTFRTDPYLSIPAYPRFLENQYFPSDLKQELFNPPKWQMFVSILNTSHSEVESIHTYPFVRTSSESQAIVAATNSQINGFLLDFSDEDANFELGNDILLLTCPSENPGVPSFFGVITDDLGTLEAVDVSPYADSREAWYTRSIIYDGHDVCLTRFRVLADDPSKLPTQIVAVSSLPDGTYLGTYTTNVVNPATLMSPRNTRYVQLEYQSMDTHWQKEDLTGMYYVVIEIRCPTSVYSFPYHGIPSNSSFTKLSGEDTIVDFSFKYPDDSCSVLASADGFMDIEGVNSMRLNISKMIPRFTNGELDQPHYFPFISGWKDNFWPHTMQRYRNSLDGYFNPYMRLGDKRYGIRLAESAVVTKLTHEFDNPNDPGNTGYGGGELALIDCSEGRVDPYLWVTTPP